MRRRHAGGAAILSLVALLTGCTGDGLAVPNDSDADAFARAIVKTAFATWDAHALCSAVWSPSKDACLAHFSPAFAKDEAAFGSLVNSGDAKAKTYWALMRNVKDAYYDIDLTYAKGSTHLTMYVMNLDHELGTSGRHAGWQLVWYRLMPEAPQ